MNTFVEKDDVYELIDARLTYGEFTEGKRFVVIRIFPLSPQGDEGCLIHMAPINSNWESGKYIALVAIDRPSKWTVSIVTHMKFIRNINKLLPIICYID